MSRYLLLAGGAEAGGLMFAPDCRAIFKLCGHAENKKQDVLPPDGE